jgi:hypothetical protein
MGEYEIDSLGESGLNCMLGWPRVSNYLNNNQHDALFIFSWLSYHTCTCFGRGRGQSAQQYNKYHLYIYIYILPPDDGLMIRPKLNQLKINSASWTLRLRLDYVVAIGSIKHRIKLSGPITVEYFSTNWTSLNFCRNSLLHGIGLLVNLVLQEPV